MFWLTYVRFIRCFVCDDTMNITTFIKIFARPTPKICMLSQKTTKSKKIQTFFISWPILTYASSFCRTQRKNQLLFQTFFSKMNISPIVAPHFAYLGLRRKNDYAQKILTSLLVDQF